MAYINIGRGTLKNVPYSGNKKAPGYKGHFTFDFGIGDDGEPKLFTIPLAAWRRADQFGEGFYFSIVSSMTEARAERENPGAIPEEVMALLTAGEEI